MRKSLTALAALVAATLCAAPAFSMNGCVAYKIEDMKRGDADFGWFLCPRGQVYEQMYGYFGIVGSPTLIDRSFFKICSWNESKASWTCPSMKWVVRCTDLKCTY